MGRERENKRSSGYTLYELLVTVAIAATVLSLGVPALAGVVARSRQIAEINALHHAIHLARIESVTRRQYVSLCPSSDGKRCSAGRNWSRGWLMFVNSDRDSPPQVDSDEVVLSVHAVDPAIRLTANRSGFTLRGTRFRATNGTFVACDIAGRASPRALVVSYTGRPRSALKKPSGELYACEK